MKDGKTQQMSVKKVVEKTKNGIIECQSMKKEDQSKYIKSKINKDKQQVKEIPRTIENEKTQYPTVNISQSQVDLLTEFNKNCGQCSDLKISKDYYKSLLISYLDLIINSYSKNKFPMDASKLMTLPIFTNICHRVSEILAAEPTLLIINSDLQNESFLVLSDIHGCFEILIYNFFYHHCLPKKKVIILGDYVDKGSDDAIICLFLFLCKIVWPDKLFLLRGNHEIRDMNRQKDFPDNCAKLLGNISTFYLFNFVFERMPIAAIWNNNVYLAHGGISQWINSRDDITNIKRPLKLNRSFKSRLIITDILWSDPYRRCYNKKDEFQKYFAVSNRGCGFAYSKEGCEEILKCLNVSMMVRGHQTSRTGFVEEYKHICYTIHSKPSSRSNSIGSSCLLYLDINGNVMLKPLKYRPNMDKDNMLNALDKLKCLWKDSTSTPYKFKKVCPYCSDKKNYLNELGCRERILITHAQLTMWMTDYKVQTLLEFEFGNKSERKWKNPKKLLSRFPIYFDFCVWPRIGQSVRSNSIISKKEKNLLYTILRKVEKIDDNGILNSDPDLTIDNLPFLCLNHFEDKKNKNIVTSSDENEEAGEPGDTDEYSEPNDISEDEEN